MTDALKLNVTDYLQLKKELAQSNSVIEADTILRQNTNFTNYEERIEFLNGMFRLNMQNTSSTYDTYQAILTEIVKNHRITNKQVVV